MDDQHCYLQPRGRDVDPIDQTKNPGTAWTELGIPSTPVIDPDTGPPYLVAEPYKNARVVHRLHVSAVAGGAGKTRWTQDDSCNVHFKRSHDYNAPSCSRKMRTPPNLEKTPASNWEGVACICGNIYAETAEGYFPAGTNLSSSVLKLSQIGTLSRSLTGSLPTISDTCRRTIPTS